MKEYVENMKEYVENMKEYVENIIIMRSLLYEGICKKYEKICGKYEAICGKYEELCRYIGLGTPISNLYGPWDLEKFRFLPLYMALGTWKNSKLCLYIGSGILENFELLPPSITACCKLSLLCFLHPSPKLSL
mgnify:CR=1 FL=1